MTTMPTAGAFAHPDIPLPEELMKHVAPDTVPFAPLRLLNNEKRAEMEKVQDVRLSARALSEAAIRYQTMPWYPECEEVRASLKRGYEKALKEMLEAING